jgi:23S rRNA pseudouridine2605 synthase
MKVRLNKFLAQSGGISRRKADSAVLEGRVSINGKIIFEVGIPVDTDRDLVRLDGSLLHLDEEKIYIIFHKPVGVLTTMKDPKGRKTVADFFEDLYPRVFPVGRLDYNSSGVILMTNDGELGNLLSHPRYEVTKEYVAKVKGIPSRKKLERLRKGIEVEGRKTKPGSFDLVDSRDDKAWVRIRITEGRYRQIRKMFALISHPVLKLRRVAFGSLELGPLPTGGWRYLSKKEVFNLRRGSDEGKGS